MRDFVFVSKDDPTVKATVRVDIIDDDFEKFTIMWMDGVQNTIFEKYMPWQLGSVVTESAINEWFAKYQPMFMGVKYGGTDPETLGATEYVLTLGPRILNGTTAKVWVNCMNSLGVVISKEVALTNGVSPTVSIVEGFEYSFSIEDGNTWASEPEPFVCDDDVEVVLNINLPNTLPVHEMIITPTILNGDTATITLTGTKAGYVTVESEIVLESTVAQTVEVYEGYAYNCSLAVADEWTSGSAPAELVCDGDEAIALGISVPIDLPIHTLTITPTLVNGLTTDITLRGEKAGYETIDTPLTVDTGVDEVTGIYEGYSYTFILDELDTWTSGSAPAAIVCDGNEVIALGITTPVI